MFVSQKSNWYFILLFTVITFSGVWVWQAQAETLNNALLKQAVGDAPLYPVLQESLWGEAKEGIALDGTDLFVGYERGVIWYDTVTETAVAYAFLEQMPRQIEAVNNLVYVRTADYLYILDRQNQLNQLTFISRNISSMIILNSSIYLSTSSNGTYQIESLQYNPSSQTIELVGRYEQANRLDIVTHQGSILYVWSSTGQYYEDQIVALDTQNPSSLQPLGTYTYDTGYFLSSEGAIMGNILYQLAIKDRHCPHISPQCFHTRELIKLDITDPSNIQSTSQPLEFAGRTWEANDNYLFAQNYNHIYIYQPDETGNLTLITTIDVEGVYQYYLFAQSIGDFTVDNDKLYVVNKQDKVIGYSLETPTTPQMTETYQQIGGFLPHIEQNGDQFVLQDKGTLHFMDASSEPILQYSYQLLDGLNDQIGGLHQQGNYLFALGTSDPIDSPSRPWTLYVLDMTDRENPTLVHELALETCVSDLYVLPTLLEYMDHLYWDCHIDDVNNPYGLGIIDIQLPTQPIEKPFVSLNEYWFRPTQFVRNGWGYSFQPHNSDSVLLNIFDFTQPDQPTLHSQNTISHAQAMIEVGDYLYVARKNQITIYDLSLHTNPVAVAQLATPLNDVWDIYLQDSTLYIFDSTPLGKFILNKYDVSNPINPRYQTQVLPQMSDDKRFAFLENHIVTTNSNHVVDIWQYTEMPYQAYLPFITTP